MSDSSRVKFGAIPEVSWGVTPSAARKNIRITGESLSHNTNFVMSEEIDGTGQNSDVVRTAVEASGNIEFEMSYGNIDDLLEGVMRDAWDTAITTSSTAIAASNSGSSFTSGSLNFTTQGMVVGGWYYFDGFTGNSGENNGWYQVTSIASGTLGVLPAPVSDETAGDTVTITGSHIHTGTTAKSFTLEKEFSDITQFMSFTGCRAGGMDLNIQPGSIITGSIPFQGKIGARGTATVGNGAPTAAPTNPVMNAVDNVTLVKENGSAVQVKITSMSFSLNNALRPQPQVGQLANSGIGSGTVEVTGNVTFYLDSNAVAIVDKYLNNTVSSLSFLLSDSLGNAYMFSFDQLKFTTGSPVTPGKDQDVVVSCDFSAYKDPTYATTMSITRLAA